MKLSFFRTKKKKDRLFLVLDIGTEAVKVLFSKKGVDGKITILGAATQYFEKYGIFSSNDFENDVLKNAILRALDGAYQNFIFFGERGERKKSRQGWIKWPVIISLSSNILPGRIFLASFSRKGHSHSKISKSEEKNIYEQLFREAKKKVSLKFSEETGILPTEIQWTALKIIQAKVDGYPVSGLCGYEGENLKIKILTVFLAKNYFQKIEKITAELKLKVLKIIHTAEVLPVIFNKNKKDGIFIDVGGENSQFFLIKSGSLEKMGGFKSGGKVFSQQLVDILGIDEETARVLKEEYSKKLLSPKAMARVKEILRPGENDWYGCLKDKIRAIGPEEFFSPNIFLFGGGSLLPEIKEVLEENRIVGLSGLPVSRPFNINFIYPNDLDNIKDITKSLKSPRNIPPLLITYSL